MGNNVGSESCDKRSNKSDDDVDEDSALANKQEESELIKSLINGYNLQILFADDTTCPCSLSYDLNKDSLHLNLQDQTRLIQLDDVKELVKQSQDVQQHHNEENSPQRLLADACVVAFRLVSSSKVILLKFPVDKDAAAFRRFLKHVIKENALNK